MGFFSRSRKLPDYTGTTIEERLADPTWVDPLADAGFDVRRAELAVIAGRVQLTGRSASGGAIVDADDAVLIAHDDRVGLAVPGSRAVTVLDRPLATAQLGVSQVAEEPNIVKAIQLFWGPDFMYDGWSFASFDPAGTPPDQQLDEKLRRLVAG